VKGAGGRTGSLVLSLVVGEDGGGGSYESYLVVPSSRVDPSYLVRVDPRHLGPIVSSPRRFVVLVIFVSSLLFRVVILSSVERKRNCRENENSRPLYPRCPRCCLVSHLFHLVPLLSYSSASHHLVSCESEGLAVRPSTSCIFNLSSLMQLDAPIALLFLSSCCPRHSRSLAVLIDPIVILVILHLAACL
jgi:hypothetical protein